MSLPIFVQTAIGLAVVYYIAGLIVSVLAGQSDNARQSRATQLKEGLEALIKDDTDISVDAILEHDLIRASAGQKRTILRVIFGERKSGSNGQPDSSQAGSAEADSGTTDSKEKDKAKERGVIDIPAANFVTAAADIIATKHGSDAKTVYAKLLTAFGMENPIMDLDGKGNDKDESKVVEDMRKKAEAWFDAQMKSVAQSYSEQMKGLTIVFAVVVTLVGNIDTFAIWRALTVDDPALRDKLGEIHERLGEDADEDGDAEEDADEDAEDDAEENAEIKTAIEELQVLVGLGLPIWWEFAPLEPNGLGEGGWLNKLVGWAVSMLALAQGGPFWYDILNRLKQVKSPTTPESKETKAK